MAITGISSYDGKQIIAAGAQSAIKAYQDSNGDVITSKYQTTANMSNYQTIAGMSDYATTASVTGKQDTLTFGYTNDQISQINGSGIYSQGGGGGGGVVTATGGTTDYVQTINGKNISAINAGSALSATHTYKANYASNGISLISIYNSARSGYAASAYLVKNVTGKVSDWNNCYSSYTSHSGFTHYYQGSMPNWWNSTASNPLCIKINTANFCTAGVISDAHLFLKQLSGPESAYTATMNIAGFKTDAQWTTKEIATFGGGVYDETNTLNPQYILWNGNVVFNAQHGGWNQSITGVFLGGTWTSTGQDLMLNITGIVSK